MVYCEVVEWWEWVGCVDVEEGSLYWLEIDLCRLAVLSLQGDSEHWVYVFVWQFPCF